LKILEVFCEGDYLKSVEAVLAEHGLIV